MSIELRLSDVDPPASEPKRTIYRDIVNLPNPVKLGLTIRYFNYDDVGLYFQITGSGAGYTFGTVNLGLLGTGANAYINLDQLASRAKPSAGDLPNGEMEENITLTLKAYTDSGYSNLKWTFERVVTVHWINSADAAFTVDFLNNFDDGTVQGWAANNDGSTFTVSIAVATDYVLSAPYSCRVTGYGSGGGGAGGYNSRMRLYKSFTTPNKSKVYGIIDVRWSPPTVITMRWLKNFSVKRDDTVLIFLGKPHDIVYENYIPINKWLRLVVPLPANSTIEIRLVLDGAIYSDASYPTYMWLDDFKIISK